MKLMQNDAVNQEDAGAFRLESGVFGRGWALLVALKLGPCGRLPMLCNLYYYPFLVVGKYLWLRILACASPLSCTYWSASEMAFHASVKSGFVV